MEPQFKHEHSLETFSFLQSLWNTGKKKLLIEIVQTEESIHPERRNEISEDTRRNEVINKGINVINDYTK